MWRGQRNYGAFLSLNEGGDFIRANRNDRKYVGPDDSMSRTKGEASDGSGMLEFTEKLYAMRLPLYDGRAERTDAKFI